MEATYAEVERGQSVLVRIVRYAWLWRFLLCALGFWLLPWLHLSRATGAVKFWVLAVAFVTVVAVDSVFRRRAGGSEWAFQGMTVVAGALGAVALYPLFPGFAVGVFLTVLAEALSLAGYRRPAGAHGNQVHLSGQVVEESEEQRSPEDLSPREFELHVAQVLTDLGWTVEVTAASGDFGVDVISRRGARSAAIQVKRYQAKVGVKAVQEAVAGALHYGCHEAWVVTTRGFTPSAKELAQSTGCLLMTLEELPHVAGPDVAAAAD